MLRSAGVVAVLTRLDEAYLLGMDGYNESLTLISYFYEVGFYESGKLETRTERGPSRCKDGGKGRHLLRNSNQVGLLA